MGTINLGTPDNSILTRRVYFGLDIGNKYTVISYYADQMPEPETISTHLGSQNYQIPTFLAKKKGLSQWFIGDDAKTRVLKGEATPVDDIFDRALNKESTVIEGETYQFRDLLVIFFKKIFSMPGQFYVNAPLERVTIVVESTNLELMELLSYVTRGIGIEQHRVSIIDKREAFYYYALNQAPMLYQYNVALFDYGTNQMVSHVLKRNMNTSRPQQVTIESQNWGELSGNKDTVFEDIVRSAFGKEVVSSVYFVGDGFDGEWMKTSLAFACKGRKAFMGKNLYSKGACYAGYIRAAKKEWEFFYLGDNELKLNLALRVLEDNELRFFSLIDAGQSWYEAKGECEVIIDGENEIEFWVQRPDSREANSEVLELTDMPERENRTTRVRITATAKSDKAITITIKDLGFGELFPSSGKVWEHTITVE